MDWVYQKYTEYEGDCCCCFILFHKPYTNIAWIIDNNPNPDTNSTTTLFTNPSIRRLQRLRVETADPVESSPSPPPVNVIKGIERMYIYDGESLDLKDKPLAVIKSNFVMRRIVD